MWEYKSRETSVTKSTGPEGVTEESNYEGELKGFGRFPSGKFVGTGTSLHRPAGVTTGSDQGVLTTTDGETVASKDFGIGKDEAGKHRAAGVIFFMTTSQKYSWLNGAIMFWEGESGPDLTYSGTGYEWK